LIVLTLVSRIALIFQVKNNNHSCNLVTLGVLNQ
jgi:hypothetical protein